MYLQGDITQKDAGVMVITQGSIRGSRLEVRASYVYEHHVAEKVLVRDLNGLTSFKVYVAHPGTRGDAWEIK